MSFDMVRTSNRVFTRAAALKRQRLTHTQPDRFLSLRQVCDLLGLDVGTVRTARFPLSDRPLPLITAWPVGVMKGSVFVHLPEDDPVLCDEAMRNGASLIISNVQVKDYPCVLVPDATAAYVRLCAALKERRPIRTVAVTGSIGKTTTKEMVGEVYRQHFRHTFANPDNTNMYYMIGHFTQLLPSDCDRYIQECHEGDPGSARTISQMIEPDIAIVTNIGLSHAMRFKDVDDLIGEVAQISAGMPLNGKVIVNADDENSVRADLGRPVVTVGIVDQTADYVAENIRTDETGTDFIIRSSDGAENVRLNILGEHNVYNALLTWAAARADQIPADRIVAGLANYRPRGVRQNTVKAGRNNTVYIDCYNASPASMRSALSTLASNPSHGRRLAVLGNMEELGATSVQEHQAIGALVAESSIDTLITYGDKAKDIAASALEHGSRLLVRHAEDFAELVSLVKETVKPGDAVLLKASHSMGFENLLKKAFPDAYARHVVPVNAGSVLRRLKIAWDQ